MPTLKQFISEWRAAAAPSYKPSTRATMESSIRAWFAARRSCTAESDRYALRAAVIDRDGRKEEENNTQHGERPVQRSHSREKVGIQGSKVGWRDLYFPVSPLSSDPAFFTPEQLGKILAEFRGTRWDAFFHFARYQRFTARRPICWRRTAGFNPVTAGKTAGSFYGTSTGDEWRCCCLRSGPDE